MKPNTKIEISIFGALVISAAIWALAIATSRLVNSFVTEGEPESGDWSIDEKEAQFDQWLVDNYRAPEHPSGFVIPYGDSPLDGRKVGAAVYTDIINRSNDYVHIMTPYLILDGEMDKYPEAAFHNVGTIDDVIAKAKRLEEE